MKKIRTNLVVGGNGGINLPVPAPSPVAITHFEREATDAQNGPPLPPPPPQMNAPVGPPPPASEIPGDFQGLVELAKRVSKSPPPHSDKAMIWATLAQAEAVNRLADLIEELVEFLGARDGEHHEEPRRLGDEVADGIVMAAEHGKKS